MHLDTTIKPQVLKVEKGYVGRVTHIHTYTTTYALIDTLACMYAHMPVTTHAQCHIHDSPPTVLLTTCVTIDPP